ncbi:MAG: extracellular solute-binding protein [Bacillota bacterium]
MKKMISVLVMAAVLGCTAVGCGSSSTSSGSADSSSADNSSAETGSEEKAPSESASSGEDTVLKIFSNLPDRNNGQGLVEQTLIDEYMAENEGIIIEVETLNEEAYKTKFRAYSMEGMPDVVSIWGQPSFLTEVLDAGVLAPLNEADYADYEFVSGSLNGFKKDGQLYGLPRNTDVAGFYYNEKMFADNGWSVPSTYDEFLTLSGDIVAAGITPVAMDGGDGWPLAIYLSDILFQLVGPDYAAVVDNAIVTQDFSDPNFVKAVEILVETVEAGAFQNGYDSQDYGTAMNLFTNGRAAMFYMGSWETSMALNQDIPEEIRENIRAFTMPVIDGGVSGATDITAWNGGGYAVSSQSEVKDTAIDFINFMYQPDKLSKLGWENGVGMSAQNQSEYISGNETDLQMQFVDMINGATNVSGTPINDCGSATFKSAMETEIQSVSNGGITVDEFITLLGEACK